MRPIHRFSALAFTCAVAVLLSSPRAEAQFEGTYQVAIKKQEEKKTARWSLADWLEQKQKNRLADLWLAKNSHHSAFEFFLEAQSINYSQYVGATPENKTNNNSYDGSLAAYAGVAGLRASYEGDTEKRSLWSGSLNIRLFGQALQDTHINLEYGLRGLTLNTPNGTTPTETFQNQYGGVSLNVYVTKHFGLEGTYRKILPAESEQKRQMQGEDSLAGLFIDFGLLRVFGNWRGQFLRFEDSAGAVSTEFREGFGGGLRVYF